MATVSFRSDKDQERQPPFNLEAELGVLGSIMLLPEGVCEWDDDLEPGETLRMGVEIGELGIAELVSEELRRFTQGRCNLR